MKPNEIIGQLKFRKSWALKLAGQKLRNDNGSFPECRVPKAAMKLVADELDIAISALQESEGQVSVKRLDWQEPSEANNYCHVAKTPIGDYYVHVDGGKHHAFFDFGGFDMLGPDADIGEPSGSLHTEQEKCQDHYSKFILGNLNR